ncbi:hypothetical protein ACHQM5_000077 [Ranunculus cassubicifolius]
MKFTKRQIKLANREDAARYPKRPEQRYPVYKPRRLKHPNLDRDVEEVRRLMKRPPTAEITNNAFCVVCRSIDHWDNYCPCLVKIEDGVVLGPSHDSACIGCGRIGETCCSRGAYAVLKRCAGCSSIGHWYWERKCSRTDIKKWAVKLPSIDGVQLPPNPHENYVSDDDVVYISTTDEEMSSDDEDEEVSFATVKDDLQA